MKHDLIVAGGGIVGLASAWRILEANPGIRLLLLEKEPALARHQTGRNSGVLHSGIYYKPGSDKAALCREGYDQMIAFAREQGVAHEICGKVIVATEEEELPRLAALEERAVQNGLAGVKRLDPAGLREIEPGATGLAALHVPQTGIIDYVSVSARLADRIRALGGEIRTNERLVKISGGRGDKTVRTASGNRHAAAFLLNCGGVYSDRIARMDGADPGMSIVPFRGEYYSLRADAPALVRHLIYPVPDPAFPFLGVHFTRMIGGGTECGPNAVLALGREAYGKFDVNLPDTAEILVNGGFRTLAKRHWRMGWMEFRRSWSKALFTEALQRLVPAVRAEMLEPREAGIRAQAMRPDGSLVDDFHFAEGDGSLHVLNAPSPAATAALAIGSRIAERFAAMRG
jgi:L-2-hydroxyglutarate oxidase